MSFCKHCVEGVRHEGTPEGRFEDIGGIKTYIATPTKDYPKNKAVLYLPDIFGYELPNSQLLADDYARNGFLTYIPDLFEGDPAPLSYMGHDIPGWDLMTWFQQHKPDRTIKRVQAVIDVLKAQGVQEFAAVGYCYGGRLVFDLAFAGAIKVAATAHPSQLQAADIERYAAAATAPLLINSCEFDPQFGEDKQELADRLFKDFKFGYSRRHFEGATHGFGTRGDLSNPKVKAAKEGAFKNTVEWFLKYL